MKVSKEQRVEELQSRVKDFAIPEHCLRLFAERAIVYEGNGQVLETAIGAYVIGHLFGWRVLRMMHGSSAYLNYEKILDVRFTEVCPERGPLWDKSIALKIADRVGGFWKVVTGKVPGRTPEFTNTEVDKI